MRSVNVLYLQDHGNLGGAQLSLRDLLKALRHYTPEVHPSLVVGDDNFLYHEVKCLNLWATILPFPQFRKWKDWWQRPRFIRQLTQICRERDIQIVHANNYHAAPWSVRLAGAAGVKSCCTVREVIDLKTLMKYRVPKNDAMITVSQAAARSFPAEVRAAVRQIYNCVPPPPLVFSREKSLAELRLPGSGEPMMGYVGALSQRKGLLHLLQALPIVLRQQPDARLVLLGGGKPAFAAILRARVADLKLADRVHFVGQIEEGSRFLRAFDLLVLPSLMEGAPRAVIEAMYVGLPVVATNAGGTAEIIEDGVTGQLVPPADSAALAEAMLGYLRQPGLREEHGARAASRARELFAPEQNAPKVARLYAEMLGQT